jgi:hypothetical protein
MAFHFSHRRCRVSEFRSIGLTVMKRVLRSCWLPSPRQRPKRAPCQRKLVVLDSGLLQVRRNDSSSRKTEDIRQLYWWLR